jgi:hypothetical protein
MTFAPALFPALSTRSRQRLARLQMTESWQVHEVLGCFRSPLEVLAAASPPVEPASRRPVLRILLLLAPADALAADVLLAALVPALRAVSGELSRWAPLDGREVEASVALGAWEALCALGGSERAWPDRAVICMARDRARASLHREVRHRRRETVTVEMADVSVGGDDTSVLVAADVVRRAVATGRITPSSARLVWELQVQGRTVSELAVQTGRSPEAMSMARLRAERALRAAVA